MGLTSIWRGLSHNLSESRRSGPPPIRGVRDRGRFCLSRVSAKWDWSLTSGLRSEEPLLFVSHDLFESGRSGPPLIRDVQDRGRFCWSGVSAGWD